MLLEDYQKRVWRIEIDILDVVDEICRKNNLKYSLAYGTLIGAVRHKGFIPWDDDIDIVMPREDYDKLLKMWNDVAPKGYLLQNKNTDSDFSQNFTKIRKDHTTFLQGESEGAFKYHKGIFIDIFPADRVAPGKVSWLIQYISCAINLLYSREFTSGTDGVIGIVEKLLLKFPKNIQKKLLNLSEKQIVKWNGNTNYKYFAPSTIDSVLNHYSANLFESMIKLEFCGKLYSCVKDYDNFLKADYGDYMQLPPEEERVWKHHPVVIDFEHNYEELKK